MVTVSIGVNSRPLLLFVFGAAVVCSVAGVSEHESANFGQGLHGPSGESKRAS